MTDNRLAQQENQDRSNRPSAGIFQAKSSGRVAGSAKDVNNQDQRRGR